MTASVAASPSPSSIIKPYWKPEQPPPCTNTRRPLPVLPSSVSSSLIFDAAVGDTLIIVFSRGPLSNHTTAEKSRAFDYKLRSSPQQALVFSCKSLARGWLVAGWSVPNLPAKPADGLIPARYPCASCFRGRPS